MWRNKRANKADADQVWRETPTQEEHKRERWRDRDSAGFVSTPTNPSSFISGSPHLYECTLVWLTCEVHKLSLHSLPCKYQFMCGKSVRVVFVCVHHLNIFCKRFIAGLDTPVSQPNNGWIRMCPQMISTERYLPTVCTQSTLDRCITHSSHSHGRGTMHTAHTHSHTHSHLTHTHTHTHHGCKQSQGCDFNYHLVLA